MHLPFAALVVISTWLQAAPVVAPPATPTTPTAVPTTLPPVTRPLESASRDSGIHVLHLADAETLALANQPSMRQARAQTVAAGGRTIQVRSAFFPQLTGIASYQHLYNTSSTYARGGAGGATGTGGLTPTPTGTSSTMDYFSVGGTASQLIWDFGQTYNRYRAANEAESSYEASEKTAEYNVVANVRRAYFSARAQKDLVDVARDALENQQRHLVQIQGFVVAGTRTEIDLAQTLTDVANARVTLINAQNAYDVARAQLVQAIGRGTASTNFDVASDEIPPVDGEDLPTEKLVARAIEARPELVALERQRQSLHLTTKSLSDNYWPSLAASASGAYAGTSLDSLNPAWSVGATLTWPFFQGGLTKGQVREAEANEDAARANIDTEKLQVRFDVEQAQLSLRAAKIVKDAAEETLKNARAQLRLAEGRYTAGVGTVIELGDAQITFTNASAQVVQAKFQLSSARVNLLVAMGRQ
ncbi:MAG: TolC family protein [Polyangiaceae bacterium]|nr:TolC family protein [Polyangiaceae bacterium]